MTAKNTAPGGRDSDAPDNDVRGDLPDEDERVHNPQFLADHVASLDDAGDVPRRGRAQKES